MATLMPPPHRLDSQKYWRILHFRNPAAAVCLQECAPITESPPRLFVPERDQRIDLRRTPRRNEAGGDRQNGEGDRGAREREGVGGLHFIKKPRSEERRVGKE